MWQPPIGPIESNPRRHKAEAEYRDSAAERSATGVLFVARIVWLLLVGLFRILRFLVRQPLRWLRR